MVGRVVWSLTACRDCILAGAVGCAGEMGCTAFAMAVTLELKVCAELCRPGRFVEGLPDKDNTSLNNLLLTACAIWHMQDGDIMHLMQMEVDADSQHTVDLLTKSASMHSAPSADAAASRDIARAGSRGPSNLRNATGPGGGAQEAGAGVSAAAAGSSKAGAGRPAAAAAAGGGGGFNFKMFGKDLEAGGGSGVLQVSQ